VAAYPGEATPEDRQLVQRTYPEVRIAHEAPPPYPEAMADDTIERDDGPAVHYLTIGKGTPIYASDGILVGKVVQMMDNKREHILDGFVFQDEAGETRFVDAPEVKRTFERAVELNIDSAEAAKLGPPETTGVTEAAKNSKLGRLFGR